MTWHTRFRSLFPVTAQKIYANIAYTSPLAPTVADALRHCLDDIAYARSDKPQWLRDADGVRSQVAALIGGGARRVAFTKNTTEGLNIVAQGLDWVPGDNLVIDDLEHPTNVMPWLNLQRRGVQVRRAVSRGWRYSVDDIWAQVDARTRLVAVSWVQYGTGLRTDLAELGRRCREAGIFFVVDGIQGAGLLRAHVDSWHVDAFSCGVHKGLLAPLGLGFLHVSPRLLGRLTPAHVGPGALRVARGGADWQLLADDPLDARRLETGNLNFPGLHGLRRALQLIDEAHPDRIEPWVLGLSAHLAQGLRQQRFSVLSPPDRDAQSATVALAIDDAPAFHAHLARAGIIASLLDTGHVRLSFGAFNTTDEVDRILEATRAWGRTASFPSPSQQESSMSQDKQPAWKLETIAVHGGYKPDPTTRAVAVPIYQTVSYAFDNTQHGADLFDLKVPGNIYTRIMNPTQDVLEQRVAALEGGLAALALASGQAAVTYAIQTIAEAGDNIVSATALYGGTYNLLAHTLPQFGIETRFADAKDPESFGKLIDARTKAVFVESIGNPLGNITDIAAIAAVAHRHGVPLIVDNTVPSPYLLRPIEHGADIVVHSLTKYLGGHGNSIGGVIVDSGKFPWAEHKTRFKRLNEPDVSYHGVVYTEALGPAAYIGRARVVPLRNTGAAISPFNAFLILQGIETLALRLDRINENALAVARYLAQHPKVEWVGYAGLPSHPDHALAQKYLGGRASGVLTFGIQGGREAGARFQDALQLFTRLVNIGDAKSLATHPASTTHRQLSPEELAKAGVKEETIRLSIGIEHIDDLKADLGQALAAA
ncbi:O-acetylhomoserine sulfhydrylase / O-succinylhomoserine sulfhydrylase [plant metagenome]